MGPPVLPCLQEVGREAAVRRGDAALKQRLGSVKADAVPGRTYDCFFCRDVAALQARGGDSPGDCVWLKCSLGNETRGLMKYTSGGPPGEGRRLLGDLSAPRRSECSEI